jgi:CXXX repeat modification system protein
MNEKRVGKVEAAERDEIEKLHQRKMALGELFRTIGKSEFETMDRLYEKALDDLGRTSSAFQAWWDRTAKKHGWTAIDGASWRIDFATCEVFLVLP